MHGPHPLLHVGADPTACIARRSRVSMPRCRRGWPSCRQASLSSWRSSAGCKTGAPSSWRRQPVNFWRRRRLPPMTSEQQQTARSFAATGSTRTTSTARWSVGPCRSWLNSFAWLDSACLASLGLSASRYVICYLFSISAFFHRNLLGFLHR